MRTAAVSAMVFIQPNNRMMWFYPLRLNSALTCWLWPGTSWWLYSIIRICCDSLHGNDLSFIACSLQHVENRLHVPMGAKKRLHCVSVSQKHFKTGLSATWGRFFHLQRVTHYMHHLSCDVFRSRSSFLNASLCQTTVTDTHMLLLHCPFWGGED